MELVSPGSVRRVGEERLGNGEYSRPQSDDPAFEPRRRQAVRRPQVVVHRRNDRLTTEPTQRGREADGEVVEDGVTGLLVGSVRRLWLINRSTVRSYSPLPPPGWTTACRPAAIC